VIHKIITTEKSPRPRSHDRYRDHSDNGERSRKHRDDYHRRDRDHEYDYEERGVDRERYRHEKRKKEETAMADVSMNKTIVNDGTVAHALGVLWLQLRQKLLTGPTEPVTEEEAKMMRTMGFCNFGTTKGKHVIGNSVYVANISKQRKYRQYMNRRGGFNSPLDPVA
ncbi:U4/U6.U5 small nuclear ribonucleoprotein 27 kDa protein, partial [Schistosoma japonicum]